MPRKYQWWNRKKKVPPKTTKQIRKIRLYSKEMDNLRDVVQELMDEYLRTSTSVSCVVISLGTIIGRRSYPYTIKFNIAGAVPLTVKELTEVDLNSIGWKKYGPLHRRGRVVHVMGLECQKDSVKIKTELVYHKFLDWIKDNNIILAYDQEWGDYYVKESESSNSGS